MKKGTRCIIAGLLLIAAALSITGYNLWDDHRAGADARHALDTLLPEVETDVIPKEGRMSYIRMGDEPVAEDRMEYPDYVLNPNMEMPVETIDGRDYIGAISIQAIERELPVFSEWSYPNLKDGPCRYVGSAYLDNMVICAHNYNKYFGSLKKLGYGDVVTFTDMDGNIFDYIVVEIEILEPTAIDQMITGDWDLTLFTCTVGGATRVTVRCEKL